MKIIERLSKFNKYCWMNVVVGILLMITGSMDGSIFVMFIGFFNLIYAAFGWVIIISQKNYAFVSNSEEVKK